MSLCSKALVVLLSIWLGMMVSGCADPDLDTDQDGLPDAYEARFPDLNPLRKDLILVPVIRPGATREAYTATLDAVKQFYASLPVQNLDGSQGINVVIRWGNTLPDEDATTVYVLLRDKGIPADLIGYGHGILIEPGQGGGQTHSLDWSGTANNWTVIVHELGHQLMLQHEVPGNAGSSPFYTSLMNYDYSYSFNGNGSLIHYSTGTFSNLRLDERNLDETLPYSSTELAFLKSSPYYFDLLPVDATHTQVDFNRNGIFGETGVQADINDGYSVSPRNQVNLERIGGSGVLATLEGRLIAILPSLSQSPDLTTYAGTGCSAQTPCGLNYRFFNGQNAGSLAPLVGGFVVGEPSAVEAFGGLLVSYPTTAGYTIELFKSNAAGDLLSVSKIDMNQFSGIFPTLVNLENGHIAVLLWYSELNSVMIRDLTLGANSSLSLSQNFTSSGISFGTSYSPVGGAWNSIKQRLVLASSDSNGRVRYTEYSNTSSGWIFNATQLVGTSAFRTSTRPTIIFDGRPQAGRTGMTYVYHLQGNPATNSQIIYVHRISLIDGRNQWRSRMMINEWSLSRSAPTATLFGDDIAYGWRLSETFGDLANVFQVYLTGSGISDVINADFDDVTWISEHGLKESLQSVR